MTDSANWMSFVIVADNFMGNGKSANYQELVLELLENFRKLWGNMSINVHYRHGNLERFLENHDSYSEEQRE